MPLPKLPSKPAALLSESAIEEANKSKPRAKPVRRPEPAPAKTVAPLARPPPAARPAPHEVSRSAASPVLSVVTSEAAQGKRRPLLDEPAKLFVLDTNVLMHDPTSLFRFDEHDVYLPMMTLE